jgi:cbb3-type cytochrome oxidase cytochrome c subunit
MPELGVVDRCTTCHTALKEASLADVKTQPFRPHPAIPHKLTEFGCVICHRGQGAATTVEEAHSSTKSWEEPILPARYLEASCGQCHLDRLTGTPRLNQGRDTLAQYGCVRCHVIKSPDGVAMTGSDAPPPLQHIADKTTREWIAAWLKNPQAYAGSATMPNFQLADDETRDISAFLIAQSTPYQTHKGTEPAPAASQDTAALQEGTSLYGESFCSSCHAMQNAAGMLVGGNLGPELTRAGSKVKTEWLADWLRDPKTYDPDTRMPHYRLDAKEVGLLIGFLSSKSDSDFLGNTQLARGDTGADRAWEDIGDRARLRQLSRHQRREEAGELRSGADAGRQPAAGENPVRARRAAYTGGLHRRQDPPAKIVRKCIEDAAVHPGAPASRCAGDGLARADPTGADAARLSAHPGTPPSNYRPAGKAGQLIDDMRCFSCHKIDGRGGDMAPELTWEGSSVRARLAGQLPEKSEHAAPVPDPPHAQVRCDRCRSQHSG